MCSCMFFFSLIFVLVVFNQGCVSVLQALTKDCSDARFFVSHPSVEGKL